MRLPISDQIRCTDALLTPTFFAMLRQLQCVLPSGSDLRKWVWAACLAWSRFEGVGEWSGVAGDVGVDLVDLVEEQGECSGQAWGVGPVELNVDGCVGVGDGAAEVEQVAGGGAVFVVVL
jgi:hypothetical protein